MSFSMQQIDKLEELQSLVCRYYKLSMEEMLSTKRPNNIAHPRMMAMYLCRRETNLSLVEIGQRFGGRDHATVIHACKKVKAAIEAMPDLKNTIKRILAGVDPAQLKLEI